MGGDHAIFLSSHIPMERFFDARDQKNSKTQGGKVHIRKLKKTRRKEWRKEKEETVTYLEVPLQMCSRCVGNTLGPSCDPRSGEPKCIGTSLTT